MATLTAEELKKVQTYELLTYMAQESTQEAKYALYEFFRRLTRTYTLDEARAFHRELNTYTSLNDQMTVLGHHFRIIQQRLDAQ
ncbi:hypothetical protein AB0O14_19230 [Microbacterium foliorum]|uniref:hypothetical protein n=1 Tax=Rothia terrae TaxID=396015 RepID=UPI00344AD398